MGAANSVEVPGGGTEGYHVLRVSTSIVFYILLAIDEIHSKWVQVNVNCVKNSNRAVSAVK